MEREAVNKAIPMVRVISTCIKYKLFSLGSDLQFQDFVNRCGKGIDVGNCTSLLCSASNVPENIINFAINELFATK